MGVDIVEIALREMTDSQEFEKLASEIMGNEGYHNIVPLGGVSDKGRDAIQESLFVFKNRRSLIFQYTLQEDIKGKIDDTINKLKAANIEFDGLVIVTNRAVSAERQDNIIRSTRIDQGVEVKIYERKTLVNRLAKHDNGIFDRHFPDIQKQIKNVEGRKRFLELSSEIVKSALLRASMTFTFNEHSGNVRKSLFDYMLIGILIDKDGQTVKEIAEGYKKIIPGPEPQTTQIKASLDRLRQQSLVDFSNERVFLSPTAASSIASTTIRADTSTQSLVADVIDKLSEVTKQKYSDSDLSIMSRNIREVLSKVFQIFGLEISNQILKENKNPTLELGVADDLVTTAKRDLDPRIGDLLVSALSEVINNPSEEQATILKHWSLAYIGLEVMNLDPTLRQFQSQRFAEKTFILDSDFLLICAIKETPNWKTISKLLQTLDKLGCKIIAPRSCIEECILHAQISFRTYDYFSDKLLSLSPELVEEHVNNAFVKGYYFALKTGVISASMSFKKYLMNYYEETSPTSFFISVLKANLPQHVQIEELVFDPTKEELEEQVALQQELERTLGTTKKAKYRSQDDITRLARTDAELFLVARKISKIQSESRELLGNSCYLVTESGHYRRSVKSLGLQDDVTIRPHSLISMLDLIGEIQISPSEFVALFENSLLEYAVSQIWSDIMALIESGIMLEGKSVTRLAWDFDQVFRRELLEDKQSESMDKGEGAPPNNILDTTYVNLIKSAATRGYKRIPPLDGLVESLELAEANLRDQKKAYQEVMDKYEVLEKSITTFGKRKQKYLKRIEQKIRPSK